MSLTGADLDALAAFGTATLAEVAPARRILDRGLRPLAPGTATAGWARTVSCAPGDNLALHLALARLERDEVLVVDYGGSLESGPFGEIMALACQLRGGRGLVIDGAVRDAAAIRNLGLPVFCRGLAIPGTSKSDRGRHDEAVRVGGVEVGPGDLVVADDDAVVALPRDEARRALASAGARARHEAEIMERLRGGETTLQVLGIGE